MVTLLQMKRDGVFYDDDGYDEEGDERACGAAAESVHRVMAHPFQAVEVGGVQRDYFKDNTEERGDGEQHAAAASHGACCDVTAAISSRGDDVFQALKTQLEVRMGWGRGDTFMVCGPRFCIPCCSTYVPIILNLQLTLRVCRRKSPKNSAYTLACTVGHRRPPSHRQPLRI